MLMLFVSRCPVWSVIVGEAVYKLRAQLDPSQIRLGKAKSRPRESLNRVAEAERAPKIDWNKGLAVQWN
jgi:hypothetical protein